MITTQREIWRGPYLDGVTNTLLMKWLACPERFRILVVDGLKEPMGWNHSIEYGSMFHVAEEHWIADEDWEQPLSSYYQKLCMEYPADQKDITKWYMICKKQFQVYIARYQKAIKDRCYLVKEQPFKWFYTLPSGREIILRGKFDSVYSIGGREIWLQENKTKGEIHPSILGPALKFNLQAMIYQCALEAFLFADNCDIEGGTHLLKACGQSGNFGLTGTIYNLIRRPLADKFAIRKKKGESDTQFYNRVQDQVVKNQDYFFPQNACCITSSDRAIFRQRILNPILERFCDWWDSIKRCPSDPWHIYGELKGRLRRIKPNPHHWMCPFGIYHSIAMGWGGDYFDYLVQNNRMGLESVDNLFPELETV